LQKNPLFYDFSSCITPQSACYPESPHNYESAQYLHSTLLAIVFNPYKIKITHGIQKHQQLFLPDEIGCPPSRISKVTAYKSRKRKALIDFSTIHKGLLWRLVS
jgi:hypothetical protein